MKLIKLAYSFLVLVVLSTLAAACTEAKKDSDGGANPHLDGGSADGE